MKIIYVDERIVKVTIRMHDFRFNREQNQWHNSRLFRTLCPKDGLLIELLYGR